MSDPEADERLWTVPNVICALRLLGAAPLAWAAHAGERELVLGIMVALLLTDWLDGKLAILLRQETTVGARLDSAADAVMYAAIALSFWWLEGDVVRARLPWFLAVAGTWGLSGVTALLRFGRLPSYHTWGAKASWLVAAAVAVVWLLRGWSEPVPWALGLVMLTNLEATCIGLLLPGWRVNVPTLAHALRIRRGAARRAKEPPEDP